MFCLNDTMRYFLCSGKTDMRKGINSLCGLVHDKMGYDVRLGDVFIFVSRSIRPLTLPRKNFLFCGNHEAAENTAILCSLLATCKAQEINPREWLNDVIAKLPYYQEKDSGKNVRELLPDVWKLKKSNTNPIGV